jgi:hypothetical protein
MNECLNLNLQRFVLCWKPYPSLTKVFLGRWINFPSKYEQADTVGNLARLILPLRAHCKLHIAAKMKDLPCQTISGQIELK